MHPEISDLFFSHEHPMLAALYADGEPPTPDAIRAAIEVDAQAFSVAYPATCQWWDVTAEALAANFLARY